MLSGCLRGGTASWIQQTSSHHVDRKIKVSSPARFSGHPGFQECTTVFLIHVSWDCCERSSSKVWKKLQLSVSFLMTGGVCQRCVSWLDPTLFCLTVNWTICHIVARSLGTEVGSTRLTHHDDANDALLFVVALTSLTRNFYHLIHTRYLCDCWVDYILFT